MAKFFINRPIVAMVISILMVIVGIVAMVQLPIAQYPNIAPPEILLTATYPGADALTLEQSVATPIEQQMSGVDNMIYMYSTSQTSGSRMQLRVDFDVTTDPSYDQVLTNLRYTQAQSQLPQDVINQGVTVIKSATSPLGLFVLYSPKGTYDALFLSNYAYINLNDPMTRVPGVGQVQIFGAGQYADPALGQSRHPGEARHHGERDRQRAAGPEHRESGRPGRRRARAAGPGVHLRGARAGPPGERRGLRERRGPGQARRLPGAGEGRGAGGARGADLLPARPPQREPRGDHRHLPAARLERHRHHEGRDEADGGGQGPLPAGPGLRDGARHDAGREGRHPGDRQDALRGARPGAPRRVHLPPGPPDHPDPAADGAGVAGRHVHGVPAPGLLDQHAVALRPRARHRPRRRRRHRGGRGGREPHRGGDVAARRRLQDDGGGVRTGYGNRPHHGGGVHPDGVRPGHHRADVPAVRGHHRRVGPHLGLQRADAEPGARGAAPAAEARDARPARVVLPRLQPVLRGGDGGLSPRE